MTPQTTIAEVPVTMAAPRPTVTSFDSGYEHSLDHLIEVRRLVEEADNEEITVPEWFKASA